MIPARIISIDDKVMVEYYTGLNPEELSYSYEGAYKLAMDKYLESKTIAEVEYECKTALGYLKKGRIHGIYFLTNTVADLDLEAVEWTRRWIQEVGEERLD